MGSNHHAAETKHRGSTIELSTHKVERYEGVEPSLKLWKSLVLPLHQ